jgi:hypothetical protein
MSAGADLGFPGVKGRRTLKTRMGNAYIPRLLAAAATDGTLTDAFLHAAGLVDPPQALMRPGVISRVLFPRRAASGPSTNIVAAPSAPDTADRPDADRVEVG